MRWVAIAPEAKAEPVLINPTPRFEVEVMSVPAGRPLVFLRRKFLEKIDGRRRKVGPQQDGGFVTRPPVGDGQELARW